MRRHGIFEMAGEGSDSGPEPRPYRETGEPMPDWLVRWIYRRLGRQLTNPAYSWLTDTDKMDVAQEVMAMCLKAWPNWDPGRGATRQYYKHVVRLKCWTAVRDHIRREVRQGWAGRQRIPGDTAGP